LFALAQCDLRPFAEFAAQSILLLSSFAPLREKSCLRKAFRREIFAQELESALPAELGGE
jgi:hypothetical protein